jgi:hypothetical protein
MTVTRGIGNVIAVVLTISTVSAFAQDGRISLIAKGNLTVGSRLFPNPTSADPVARAQSYEFDNFFGLGVEVKYRLPGSSVALGLSTDYIKRTQSRSMVASNRVAVPTDDGFVVIPIELTGYFNIPVTDGPFALFIGGGVGVYFGERNYSIAGITASPESGKPGYGIHVLGGVSYRFTEYFSLIAEMKFRDAQFESTNTFEQSSIPYRDVVVTVSQTPFVSSLHVDGMVLQLGAAVSF